MESSIWLVDLNGNAELADGSFRIDGAMIERAARRCIAFGIRTGLFSPDVSWVPVSRLRRADGDRAWFDLRASELDRSPPDGVWLRADLVIRHGATHLGTLRWLGLGSNGTILEYGIKPRDATLAPRLLTDGAVTNITDRSIEVNSDLLADQPLLRTDRAIEDSLRRLLWETDHGLPHAALQQISLSLQGGIVNLWGRIPREQHRRVFHELVSAVPGVRGLVDRMQTAEAVRA